MQICFNAKASLRLQAELRAGQERAAEFQKSLKMETARRKQAEATCQDLFDRLSRAEAGLLHSSPSPAAKVAPEQEALKVQLLSQEHFLSNLKFII